MNSKPILFAIFVIIATSLYFEEVEGGAAFDRLKSSKSESGNQPANEEENFKEAEGDKGETTQKQEHSEDAEGDEGETAQKQEHFKDAEDDEDIIPQKDVNFEDAADKGDTVTPNPTEDEGKGGAAPKDETLSEDEALTEDETKKPAHVETEETPKAKNDE